MSRRDTKVGQLAPEKLPPALSLRGIEVSLGGAPILQGVDLDVHRGEVLALVGPNGAGKSTLLAVASGDVASDAGTVVVLGEEMSSLPPRRVARLRSVMLQEQRLAFGFTAYEVVEMGRTPWYRHPEEERDEIAVEQAMRRTDVTGFTDRRYPTLSGGEKSRVSLARVLAQEAPLLLLDEPTAALDVHHQEQVLATARDLAQTGASAVVVLHDLSLDVPQGAFFGIVGHTGSGKSTLLSLLLRYYVVEQGSIESGGVLLAKIGNERFRNEVGLVPQDPFILAASAKPLVLISGGVGITPTLPMLEAALASERPVHFIHCARNGGVPAFREWVDELAARNPQLKRFYCYAEDDGVSPAADQFGLLSQEQLGQWLPQAALCCCLVTPSEGPSSCCCA